MTMTSVFAPITKSVDQDDGTILVYGKATDGGLDLDDQRCDPQWLSEAMPAWFGTGSGVGGNIRAQHRADSAVGKAIDHEVAADGHYITARIVDRDAIAKTKAGVFTGFSIGIRRPKIVKSTTAPNGTISGGSICEVSLVDRPANPSCLLTMCKAAKPGMKVNVKDYDAEHNLIKCEELTEKTVDVETVTVPDVVFKVAEPLTEAPVEDAPEAEAVEKATDVAHLDAPAPGQTCADCGEDGHLRCKSVELDETGQLEFDLEAAKALVAETLTKADDEGADIANAQSAIAIIAQLIAAEATDLASDPGEACDIALLLQAVDALRCFQRREQAEQLNGNDPVLMLAADPDVDKAGLDKAKYTAEQKRQMLADGKAFKNPDGEPSYPIGDKDDLTKAIHAVGRGSGDHDSIRAYIIRRAKALGASDLIPEDWSGAGGGANKAVEIEPKTSPEAAEKAVTVETSKAVAEPDPDDGLETALLAILEKAASEDAQKADNPIRARLSALMRAEAEGVLEASTKSTEKSVSDLTESFSDLTDRLVKVESMAIPGGPALRRTEVEVKSSRKQELTLMAVNEERKASAHGLDTDLRRGYLEKAAGLRAQANAV